MNKIGELLNEHDNLCGELMNDEEFVRECEKIFEENGLEFSEDMLKEILADLEDNLKEVRNLPDDKLADVVGGVDPSGESKDGGLKKARSKSQIAGAIAIKVTSTVIGTVLGGGIGLFLGTKWKWKSSPKFSVESGETTTLSGVIGGGTGSVVGYRLGTLISKKLGLED